MTNDDAAAIAERLTIGEDVSSTDGAYGEVRRLIVDPLTRSVTHLVVEPKHRRSGGRLVPVALVDSTGSGIEVRCSTAELNALAPAEETRFVPTPTPNDLPGGDVLLWPYYGLGMASGGFGGGIGIPDGPTSVTTDAIPLDEVDVERNDAVHASDGEIGRVKGLAVDPATRHVTHVLLQEGHLWGRREVAIPIGLVSRIDIGICVDLTREQVRELPPVMVEEPTGGVAGPS